VTHARLFAAVGVAAIVAGALSWQLGRSARQGRTAEPPPVVAIAPSALFAATFVDAAGATRALGQFEGKVLVLNFWATWCEPCRAEMPAFERLHRRWADRGVQFLGLSDEAPSKAQEFGRAIGVGYPLWTGGDQVADLSRRLGNRLGGLPHTVVVDPKGAVAAQKVGPYTEAELEAILAVIAGKVT
jgi:thiol-disulfide isomerase/thioredoxin